MLCRNITKHINKQVKCLDLWYKNPLSGNCAKNAMHLNGFLLPVTLTVKTFTYKTASVTALHFGQNIEEQKVQKIEIYLHFKVHIFIS